MSHFIGKTLTPRHGIRYDAIPTIKGSMYGGSIELYSWRSYGDRLDSIFEMADQISNGNGVTVEAAVEQACRDEGWRLLPTHKRAIAQLLEKA